MASPNGELVSVKVMVYFISATGKVFSSSHQRELTKCDVIALDNENAVRVTIWEQLIGKVEVGNSYQR